VGRDRVEEVGKSAI